MDDHPPTPKLRVMVDANVLFAGTIWPRFPYAVLQHAAQADYQLVLSPLIIHEARTHIARYDAAYIPLFDEFLSLIQFEKVPSPSDEEIAANATLVRDLKDVHVALSAINANVDVLVSSDKDLTAQDETTVALRERLTVLLPGTFLRVHMGWSGEMLESIRYRTWDDVPPPPQ